MRRLYTVSAIKRSASDTGAPALVSRAREAHVESAGELVGPCALRSEGAPDPGKLMLEAGDLGFERHIGFPWFFDRQDRQASNARLGQGQGGSRGRRGRRSGLRRSRPPALPAPQAYRDGGALPAWAPAAHGASYTEERTYRDLVGPLGRKRAVCAECLFVDPVADIALLGPPDSQDLGEQHEPMRG